MEETKQSNKNPESSASKDYLTDVLVRTREYAVTAWRYRTRIVLANFVVAVCTAAFLLIFARPFYESTITILPEYGNKSMIGGLASLASLAGVSFGEGAPTEIYENLIYSEAVIAPVFYAKYKTEEFKDSVNLIEYFEITPDPDLSGILQERKMFLELYKSFFEGRLKSSVDRITKVLAVTVRMPESQLSADVANNLTASLDEYVRTKRKSFASNQRFYLEKRSSQVKDSLTMAEELLKDFREKNKIVSQSPMLMLEQSRLIRNVEILQTVFMQLTQQLELAKIDEIRDAPVLNVKELASDPILKAGPMRTIRFLFVMIVFFIGSIVYYFHQQRIRSYISVLFNS